MATSRPRIRLFAMDVDGTLTDGRITYTADGIELKSFHARDGAGIKLLAPLGITPAICSGRASDATARRARELGIEIVHQGVADKAAVLEQICAAVGLETSDAAFVGDDLSDIPAMLSAGWSAAPSDAAPEVREIATHVCATPGGRGAVREAIEALLREQGQWDSVMRPLQTPSGHE